MGVVSLVDNQRRTRFFREIVLRNLEYWLAWLDEVKERDIEDLDSERSNIVKAILFALDLGKLAWPMTHQLLTAFSSYMERRGQWETWSGVLSRAIDQATRMDDTAGIATLSALLARLLFWQSRFQESTSSYRTAVKAARQIGNRFVEAQACSNLGYYYIEHGFWYRAEVLCCHALNLFEQIDSDHGRAHTENHLGILYTWQGSWDNAQSHLVRACTIWQRMDDTYGLMNGYNNLGRLFNEMDRFEEALIYLEMAMQYARKAGVESAMGNIFINVGIAHRGQGDLARAEDYFWQAEAIFHRYATLAELARVQDNLGLVYLEQRRWEKAKTHLECAQDAWRNLSKTFNQVQTLTFLAEGEFKRGDKQQGRVYLDEARTLLNRAGHAKPYQRLHEKIKKFVTA
jgi:tetratricopeptide (TPR) repeat protein